MLVRSHVRPPRAVAIALVAALVAQLLVASEARAAGRSLRGPKGKVAPTEAPTAPPAPALREAILTLHMDATGRTTLDGGTDGYALGADAALREAIRSQVPAPPPAARARMVVEGSSPAEAVRGATAALVAAGIREVDVATGPWGTGGYAVVGTDAGTGPTAALPSALRPPLTVHLRVDGVVVGRKAETSVVADVPPGPARDALLGGLLDADRRLHPEERAVVLDVDDGVSFSALFSALAVADAHAYVDRALLGGPPDVAAPSAALVPIPQTPPSVPSSVRVDPRGTILVNVPPLARLAPGDIVEFLEDCASGSCVLVAVPRAGIPVVVGARPPGNNPARAWIFSRPVRAAPGYTAGVAPFALSDDWLPVVRVDAVDSMLEGLIGPPTPDAPGGVIRMGALDRRVIAAVVEGKMDALRACYLAGVERSPAEAGEVTFTFIIGRDGAVVGAEVRKTTLWDATTETCMLDALRSARFPKPEGDGVVIVTYPFTFSLG